MINNKYQIALTVNAIKNRRAGTKRRAAIDNRKKWEEKKEKTIKPLGKPYQELRSYKKYHYTSQSVKKSTFHLRHQVQGCQNDLQIHQMSSEWEIQHNLSWLLPWLPRITTF